MNAERLVRLDSLSSGAHFTKEGTEGRVIGEGQRGGIAVELRVREACGGYDWWGYEWPDNIYVVAQTRWVPPSRRTAPPCWWCGSKSTRTKYGHPLCNDDSCYRAAKADPREAL